MGSRPYLFSDVGAGVRDARTMSTSPASAFAAMTTKATTVWTKKDRREMLIFVVSTIQNLLGFEKLKACFYM